MHKEGAGRFFLSRKVNRWSKKLSTIKRLVEKDSGISIHLYSQVFKNIRCHCNQGPRYYIYPKYMWIFQQAFVRRSSLYKNCED